MIRRDVGGGHLASSSRWLIRVCLILHRQISVRLILFFTHKSEYYRNFLFNHKMTPKLSILSLHCSLFTTGSWVSHQKRCRLECNGEEGKKEDDEKEEAAAAMVVPPTAKSFSGNKVHEWNTMISWLEKSIVLEWLEKETSRAGRKLGVNNNNSNNNSLALSTWLLQLHQQANAPSSATSSTY